MGDKLTPVQVARLIGVSPDTVRKWIRQGKLKAEKKGDRYWIDPEQISSISRASPEQIPIYPDQMIVVLQERIRELEKDKAYLQERVIALEKHIEALKQTIDAQQQTINTLTLRALPSPHKGLIERVREMFKRRGRGGKKEEG